MLLPRCDERLDRIFAVLESLLIGVPVRVRKVAPLGRIPRYDIG